MDRQELKKNVFTSPRSADASRTTSCDRIRRTQRTIQSFVVIWVDDSIDKSTEDSQNALNQLRSIVDEVNIFTEWNEAADFLTEIHVMKAFLIVQSTISQQIVPVIHDIPQLHAIYILCSNKSQHEQWANEWVKIKGFYTDIKPICEALQRSIEQCNRNSIAVSFLTMSEGVADVDLNQLEPSFMYTQIFKDILLEIEYNEQSIENFTRFWRLHYINNIVKLNDIAEFEHDYGPQSAIRWYTREYFIYHMLNRALRTLEADIIIDMGFFIRDLHKQIEELHEKQISNYHEKPLVVYRGQGLSKMDFEKLLKTKGGLMSFNNFLSTSADRNVPLVFAMDASTNTDMVGIFFKMTIDPTVSSAPFASIRAVSYFETEDEILFSMHTIFRIDEITKFDSDSSIYQVDLHLTADNDQELLTLTERIRSEVADDKGWGRLGLLLLKIGQFDKAEELYNILLEQAPSENEKAYYYQNLGYAKRGQGDYKNATDYHEKALEIFEKTLAPNHPHVAISCGSIASMYNAVGEYSKALSFYDKTLEIQRKALPSNHPDLATSYNNIAAVYMQMGNYSNALSFYEKSLEIRQKTLPSNHPDFAQSYNNIGEAHLEMGDYTQAQSFYEKALQIQQKTLPSNHPWFANAYNNIGGVYSHMGNYSKALSFYEKTLEMQQKALPSSHPTLAACYKNIAGVYMQMGNYSNALSFYEKALEMQQKISPQNYPLLATTYGSIAGVYMSMEQYSKALSFYEKALEIQQEVLLPNHPELATSYNNIGLTYSYMSEYSKAITFYEKALPILQQTLPSNHPSIATAYGNTAGVYVKMEDFPKALSFYEKTIEIQERTLPSNHPLLGISYNNIGVLYRKMKEYAKAISYLQSALNIFQNSLPPNHPNINIAQKHIDEVKKELQLNL